LQARREGRCRGRRRGPRHNAPEFILPGRHMTVKIDQDPAFAAATVCEDGLAVAVAECAGVGA
jgi:hypothetical protein